MMRTPPLPLVPGNAINTNIGQTRFHRTQHFQRIGDVTFFIPNKPGVGGVPLPNTEVSKYPSVYARGEGTDLPPWIVYDKMTLAFDAYLKERIPEERGYNFIIRKCKIYFYLEDGSIKVVEKRNPKSHFPQAGCILSRQRIPFPATGNSDDYYDIIDLNVGKTVELHGREFNITGCDAFTRTFLNRLGIPVPDPLPVPEDPFEAIRSQGDHKRIIKNEDKVKSLDDFLNSDSRILSFDAYWDDRKTTYGYVHLLKVYYYLSEDAIEIKDITDHKRPFTIVKKGKLPKESKQIIEPGGDAKSTVLNVIGTSIVNSRSLLDPLNLGKLNQEVYTDKDLALGAVINAYGKRIVITNCDKFTQDYYRVKYGLDDFTPLNRPLTIEEEELNDQQKQAIELPPYNGYGTYEDSALNCMSITPFTIVKSFKKFYEKDKEGYDSRVLRFSAKLISKDKLNDDRNFVICYFIVDDTITVYEITKGCFDTLGSAMMSRRKMFHPEQDLYGSKTPKSYTHEDFYLGNVVTLESHNFLLTGADEYAFKYMELHPNEFPKSNLRLIMDKIVAKVKPKYKTFAAQFFIQESMPPVQYYKLRQALKEICGDDITEQEIMTIARHYRTKSQQQKFSYETLRRCTHDELKRKLFNDFERLFEAFVIRDPERTGWVSKEDAYTVLRGAKVPLDMNHINYIITEFANNEKCQIKYADLLQFFDYKNSPTTPLMPINIPGNMSWMNLYKPDSDTTIEGVDVSKFINEMNLEEELKQQA